MKMIDCIDIKGVQLSRDNADAVAALAVLNDDLSGGRIPFGVIVAGSVLFRGEVSRCEFIDDGLRFFIAPKKGEEK